MRLALALAAPFPTLQGSQRYVAEQAREMQKAGVEVTLFTYGSGSGHSHAELDVIRTPAGISPRTLRSRLQPSKILADVALGACLLHENRRRPFDGILAHNAEAAAVALAIRPLLGRPVVYMVHTLWEEELESYLPSAAAGMARRLGARIDRGLASRSDAIIALSREAEARLEPFSRGSVARIAPSYEVQQPPNPEDVASACDRHGLEPEGYVLYPGNLDRYQNLSLLDAAAGAFELGPVVAGAHDTSGTSFPNLRTLTMDGPEILRHLIFGARIVVVPRRAVGGFPIKALQAMEAARPIVALEGVIDNLVHDESAWLLPQGADARDLAATLQALWTNAPLRTRLGKAAQATLAQNRKRGDALSAISRGMRSAPSPRNSGKNVPTTDR